VVIYIQVFLPPFKFLSCYILVRNSDILSHSSSLMLEERRVGLEGAQDLKRGGAIVRDGGEET